MKFLGDTDVVNQTLHEDYQALRAKVEGFDASAMDVRQDFTVKKREKSKTKEIMGNALLRAIMSLINNNLITPVVIEQLSLETRYRLRFSIIPRR